MSLPRLDQPFVRGSIDTSVGKIPQVSSELTSRDWWGAFKVRCNVGRMSFTVDPGLYALGQPTSESAVVVTANYKLTFDHLRKALSSVSARYRLLLLRIFRRKFPGGKTYHFMSFQANRRR